METEVEISRRLTTLNRVRRDFRAAIERPLHRAILQRTPIATAQKVWELPLEAASAGFRLEAEQTAEGWHIALTREIDADTKLHAVGDAKSLIAALVRIVESTNLQLTHFEGRARFELDTFDTAAIAA